MGGTEIRDIREGGANNVFCREILQQTLCHWLKHLTHLKGSPNFGHLSFHTSHPWDELSRKFLIN